MTSRRNSVLLLFTVLVVVAGGLTWWWLGTEDTGERRPGTPELSQARADEFAQAMASGDRDELVAVVLPAVLSEITDDELPMLANAVDSVTVLQDTFEFSELDDRAGSVVAEADARDSRRFLLFLSFDRELWWITATMELK